MFWIHKFPKHPKQCLQFHHSLLPSCLWVLRQIKANISETFYSQFKTSFSVADFFLVHRFDLNFCYTQCTDFDNVISSITVDHPSIRNCLWNSHVLFDISPSEVLGNVPTDACNYIAYIYLIE